MSRSLCEDKATCAQRSDAAKITELVIFVRHFSLEKDTRERGEHSITEKNAEDEDVTLRFRYVREPVTLVFTSTEQKSTQLQHGEQTGAFLDSVDVFIPRKIKTEVSVRVSFLSETELSRRVKLDDYIRYMLTAVRNAEGMANVRVNSAVGAAVGTDPLGRARRRRKKDWMKRLSYQDEQRSGI